MIEPTTRNFPTMDPTGLHGIVGDIARVATEHSEASQVAVAAYGLGYFSAAIGRNCHQSIGDGQSHARPWSLLVGASSRARKGTAENLPARIFHRAEEILAQRCARYKPLRVVHGGIATGPGLIHALRDPSSAVHENGLPVDPGTIDKRVHYVEPEAGNVLTRVKQQSDLAKVMQNFFDGKNAQNDTKKQAEAVTHPHVVVTGNITVAELLQLAGRRQIENGFLNRFLLLHVHRSKLVALPRPTAVNQVEALAEKLTEALEFCLESREINFTPDAVALWQAIYPELTAEIPGVVGSLMARSEVYARMLAMIFALLDCKAQIEPEHLRAGLAWVDYAHASATYFFGNSDALPEADHIQETADRILAALACGEKTKTDLHSALGRHRTQLAIDQALDQLKIAQRISARTEATTGRARTVYCLIDAAIPPAAH